MLVKGLDLRNAIQLTRMGLRSKQTGGVLAAYFRGARLPSAATLESGMLPALSSLPSDLGRAATRIGALGLGGMVGMSMMPRSDAVAIPAAAGAFSAAFAGLGGVPALNRGPTGQALRLGAGLMAGSIAYQGLRSPRPSDFQ